MEYSTSNEARDIKGDHDELVLSFQEKWFDEMTPLNSLFIMVDDILDLIQKIDAQLTRATVRIHRNANLRRPEVDRNSSRRDILRRLRNQINSACQLADLIDKEGPAANISERNALDTIKLEFARLFDSNPHYRSAF